VLVVVLAVWQLDSAAAEDGGACFTMCLMLMSCAPRTKSAIFITLLSG